MNIFGVPVKRYWYFFHRDDKQFCHVIKVTSGLRVLYTLYSSGIHKVDTESDNDSGECKYLLS